MTPRGWRRLAGSGPCPVWRSRWHELEGDPTSLIDAWDGSEHVIVIDAVCSGAEPGTVHRLDRPRHEPPA